MSLYPPPEIVLTHVESLPLVVVIRRSSMFYSNDEYSLRQPTRGASSARNQRVTVARQGLPVGSHRLNCAETPFLRDENGRNLLERIAEDIEKEDLRAELDHMDELTKRKRLALLGPSATFGQPTRKALHHSPSLLGLGPLLKSKGSGRPRVLSSSRTCADLSALYQLSEQSDDSETELSIGSLGRSCSLRMRSLYKSTKAYATNRTSGLLASSDSQTTIQSTKETSLDVNKDNMPTLTKRLAQATFDASGALVKSPSARAGLPFFI